MITLLQAAILQASGPGDILHIIAWPNKTTMGVLLADLIQVWYEPNVIGVHIFPEDMLRKQSENL